jgi:hypothetical protein
LINNMTNNEERQTAFKQMFRSFIIKSHSDFETCSQEDDGSKKLPLFYPHQDHVRGRPMEKKKLGEAEVPLNPNCRENPTEKKLKPTDKKVKPAEDKVKPAKNPRQVKDDAKNSYSRSLLSILGTFFLLINAAKQGNGLLTYILQKKLHKPIQQSGHKNYAVSLLSYKHTVLGHQSAQFSHQFMWNTSAGGKGKGNKFPRDQKVEHINRFLKDCFRSLGPNLNPVTARRVNNSSDFGIKLEEKLVNFFELTKNGKSHTQKDHTAQVNKISTILRKECIVGFVPGRKFKGPNLKSNFFDNFDEVKFRTWHLIKDKELHRSSKRYRL